MSDKIFVSAQAVRWVLLCSVSEGSARLALIAIAVHCNEDGYCWPSLETICHYANLSKPTVLWAIEELERVQEIEVERGGQGQGKRNHYFLPKFLGWLEGESTVKKGKDFVDLGQLSVNPGCQLSVNPGCHEQTIDKEGKEEKGKVTQLREDPIEVFKECKRFYRRKTGKTCGTPGNRFEGFSHWVEKKSGDVVFEAFKLWVEEQDRKFLRTVKWPFAMFVKNIGEYIEAYEEKIVGEGEIVQREAILDIAGWTDEQKWAALNRGEIGPGALVGFAPDDPAYRMLNPQYEELERKMAAAKRD